MYDKSKEKLPKWANAKKVLPKELYYELVQYASGMNVTIPPPNIEIKEPLSDFIWGLHQEGYQAKVIAKIVGKCRQQVNRIINKRYGRPKEMRVDTPIDIWRKQLLDGYYKDYIACK